jgi:hypothetical protein
MVYAVTIGTVHADVAFQPEYFSSRVQGGSGPTAVSVERPIRRHSHDSGCLLCLLGQQLSSSTLSAAVFVYQPTPPGKGHHVTAWSSRRRTPSLENQRTIIRTSPALSSVGKGRRTRRIIPARNTVSFAVHLPRRLLPTITLAFSMRDQIAHSKSIHKR